MDISVKTEIIEVKKITASDGMVLTNGEIYGKEIYLGKFDSPNKYREITKEEYTKITGEEVVEYGNQTEPDNG